MAVKDISGERFGRWSVIRFVGLSNSKKAIWECKCDCGTVKNVVAGNLISGKSKSCGCYAIEQTQKYNHENKIGNAFHTTHGLSRKYNRLYRVWCSMKKRCECGTDHRFHDYGGRGIRLCEEWHRFEEFCNWAHRQGYKDDAPRGIYTIDRIDNNKGYSPDNCRLATYAEQNRNRRNCKTCLIHQII